MIPGLAQQDRPSRNLVPQGFVRVAPLLDYNQPSDNSPTNVINFERATLRVSRNGSGTVNTKPSFAAHIGVIRTYGDGHSVTILIALTITSTKS